MGHPGSMSSSKRPLNGVRALPGLRVETWRTQLGCAVELARREFIVVILAVRANAFANEGRCVDT
jgi:hypothetical protein